ncbi:MAG TPA: Crp/Fnr family transcriptional regulator [Pilimelia sp.]|nr:Crp/Fnr family transcriptional regulator [Pilimelia sp.]
MAAWERGHRSPVVLVARVVEGETAVPHHARSAAVARTAEALAATELFAGVPADIRAELAAEAVPRQLRAGERLWTQGDRPEALAVLVSGTAAVYRHSPYGERAMLSLVRAPDVLGEVAVFDGRPHPTSVDAVLACATLLLSRSAVHAAVNRSRETCQAVLTQLGTQVRQLTEQRADFVFLDLPGRTAKALLRFAGATTPATVEVSQTTLARLVGGARQTVNEVVMQFARRGWLHVEPGRMIITDPDALRRRSGQPDPPA